MCPLIKLMEIPRVDWLVQPLARSSGPGASSPRALPRDGCGLGDTGDAGVPVCRESPGCGGQNPLEAPHSLVGNKSSFLKDLLFSVVFQMFLS